MLYILVSKKSGAGFTIRLLLSNNSFHVYVSNPPGAMPAPFSNFPPIVGVRWYNVFVLTVTPLIAGYGLLVAPLHRGTVVFSMLYYVFSMLGQSVLSV
jgi:hypothetical protein